MNNIPPDPQVPAPPVAAPPPPPPLPAVKPSSFRTFLAACLSLCLGLFLAAGAISLVDDSLVLMCGQQVLTLASGLVTCLSFFVLLVVYVLMGLTPIVPRRVFLPIFALVGLGLAAVFPVMIYGYNQLVRFDWLLSLLQVLLVSVIWRRLLGGGPFRWFVIEARHLGNPRFSWSHLAVFLLVNLLVLAPVVAGYVAVCTSVAVSHFTDGFLRLRPSGLILQSRKYARDDGKTVVLFPMSHIADAGFYQAMSHSVASNSVVLLEGVTDSQHLLTNKLSYKRAAKSLGLAEQHEDLSFDQGELIRADVDVQEFSTNTIAFMNLVTLVHTRGLNADTLPLLMNCSLTPEAEQQLFTDLLVKRNEHLLKELRARLPESDHFVIPWGAAHMPELAETLQKLGFHLVETHDYIGIRFGVRSRTGKSDAGRAIK